MWALGFFSYHILNKFKGFMAAAPAPSIILGPWLAYNKNLIEELFFKWPFLNKIQIQNLCQLYDLSVKPLET